MEKRDNANSEDMNKKERKKKNDLDILEIQIYSENSHVTLSSQISYIISFLIGFLILFYTLYYEQKISLTTFSVAVIVTFALLFSFTSKSIIDYENRFKKTSNMIKSVEEGNNLPELIELKKRKD